MTGVFHLCRDEFISRVEEERAAWDVVIIGGGATGLGAAVDSAARGYRTLLLEQSDFGKGTSSRSTKLVHGGVRYLQQGNLSLVLEALKERGLLLRNAPHLAHDLKFVVPCYGRWERAYYGAGLKTYDLLSKKLSLGRSRFLSREETSACLPNLKTDRLRGGVLYHDGQFDDARLAINLAQTAASLGAVVLNYARVEALEKENGRIRGVVAVDLESGRKLHVRSRSVVNATGVFADDIRRMDFAEARKIIRPSQGIHIVLDGSFLPGGAGLMVPNTDDGRVLFGVPWHGRLVLGTTDTPLEEISLEPRPLEEEIEFLLAHAGRYLERAPSPGDVLSTFAGLRPLVSTGSDTDTASISRDHVLRTSRSGLITITGGKWTTYRKMGEDAVDKAAEVAGLERRPCRTEHLPIRGWTRHADVEDSLSVYGADAPAVRDLISSGDGDATRLHPRLPYYRGEVAWAATVEMARTVEDVLSRRTRALLLDARASIEAAPEVAHLLAAALGRNEAWEHEQVAEYERLASGYVIGPPPAAPKRAKTLT